jgi:DNA-binding NarL/FixJ family response regulator
MAPRILIVDPEASAARVTCAGIRRALPEARCHVEIDLERATRQLRLNPPDVLIVDPPQRSLSAIHLVAALKRHAPAAKVIILASARIPELRRELEWLGIDAWIEKPVPLPLLIGAVAAVLPSDSPLVVYSAPPEALAI